MGSSCKYDEAPKKMKPCSVASCLPPAMQPSSYQAWDQYGSMAHRSGASDIGNAMAVPTTGPPELGELCPRS